MADWLRCSDSKLNIRGLPQDMTEEDLEKICGDFGGVKRCQIFRNKTNEISYATCEYEDVEDATKAIPLLKESPLNLEVTVAQLRENCTVIVQNLPVSVSEAAFQKTFEQFGKITECRVVMNGYKNADAFCAFEKGSSAQKAIDEFNGKKWPKTVQKILTVRFADSDEAKLWRERNSEEAEAKLQRKRSTEVEDNQESKRPRLDVKESSKEQQKGSVAQQNAEGNEAKGGLRLQGDAVGILHGGIKRAAGNRAKVIDLRKKETIEEKDATARRDAKFVNEIKDCNITASGSATVLATGGKAEATAAGAKVFTGDVDDLIRYEKEVNANGNSGAV